MRRISSEGRLWRTGTTTASAGIGTSSFGTASHARAPPPIRGWTVFLFENHAMLLVYLMVLLVCAGNVARESDGKTWLLLHTAKNGKGETLAAKYLAGPLSLSRPLKYFESYYTANLFGFPVLWAVVQVVLWSFLGTGCFFLARKVYHRKREAV